MLLDASLKGLLVLSAPFLFSSGIEALCLSLEPGQPRPRAPAAPALLPARRCQAGGPRPYR